MTQRQVRESLILWVKVLFLPSTLLFLRFSDEIFAAQASVFLLFLVWFLVFVGIFLDSRKTISGLNLFLCNAIFQDRQSWGYKLLSGRISTNFFSLIVGSFLSTLLLIFSYTVFLGFFFALFLLSFIYLWLTRRTVNTFNAKLTEDASVVSQRFAVSASLVFLLVVSFVGLSILQPAPSITFTQPEIYDVVDSVTHAFKPFQQITRAAYLFDLAARTIGNLEGVARWLSVLIQATTISIGPLVAYVMCLRSVGEFRS